jgi:hypothetical protein
MLEMDEVDVDRRRSTNMTGITGRPAVDDEFERRDGETLNLDSVCLLLLLLSSISSLSVSFVSDGC